MPMAGTGGCRDRHLLGCWWVVFPAGCWPFPAVSALYQPIAITIAPRFSFSTLNALTSLPWLPAGCSPWLEGTRLAEPGCWPAPPTLAERLAHWYGKALGTQLFGAAPGAARITRGLVLAGWGLGPAANRLQIPQEDDSQVRRRVAPRWCLLRKHRAGGGERSGRWWPKKAGAVGNFYAGPLLATAPQTEASFFLRLQPLEQPGATPKKTSNEAIAPTAGGGHRAETESRGTVAAECHLPPVRGSAARGGLEPSNCSTSAAAGSISATSRPS